jgi:hypothetical protein
MWNWLPPSSGYKMEAAISSGNFVLFYETIQCQMLDDSNLHIWIFAEYFFDPEDGGDMFLRNVG